MRRRLLLLSVIIISLAISGCIDSTTKVTVNGDGSGIITETMGMSKEVVKQMQQMMPVEDGQAVSDDDFFKREDFVEKASEYGQGVKLIDFKTSSNEKSVYAQAVFEFDDIAKIRLKQGDTSGMADTQTETDEQQYITFNFDKSSDNPTLKINIPQKDTTDAQSAQPPAAKPSAGEAAMMKQMFAGMHFAGLIEVNGKITSTNADYVEGSTITLFDIQFDKILDRPEILAQLQASQGSQPSQDMLKGVEGIKLDTNKEIDITFMPSAAAAVAGNLDAAVASSAISSPMDFSAAAFMTLLGGMALIIMIPYILVSLLYVWFFARILRKAGFASGLAFLLLIPVANGLIGLILLMILAFVDWPVYDKFAAINEQMNESDDDLVVDEPVVITEEPEIKIDDTSAFSKKPDTSGNNNEGVPLPGESNHTIGSLDSEKIAEEKPKSDIPDKAPESGPEIILSNGSLKDKENQTKPSEDKLASQTPPLETPESSQDESLTSPPKDEAPKVIEIPDVESPQPEAPEQDVVEPAAPSMPQANEDELKLPEVESEDELKLPETPDTEPKLPLEDEKEDKDKDKDTP
jgi:hypothetical protein